jgi:hypothetical protein
MSGERHDSTVITAEQVAGMKRQMTTEQNAEQRATNGLRIGGLVLPVVQEGQGSPLEK